jgi:c-di-GMP-binding flagellar brake protein YcgR
MYTNLILRNLAQRTGPIEGYVVDLSESGMAIEADSLVPLGQVVTVEFQIAGVGSLRNENWPEFAAAAEVVRHDNLEDFPGGPYRMALRFVKMSTMAQAQIARYVATQPA